MDYSKLCGNIHCWLHLVLVSEWGSVMNKSVTGGAGALLICGVLVFALLSMWIGIFMMIGGVVWHFAKLEGKK